MAPALADLGSDHHKFSAKFCSTTINGLGVSGYAECVSSFIS